MPLRFTFLLFIWITVFSTGAFAQEDDFDFEIEETDAPADSSSDSDDFDFEIEDTQTDKKEIVPDFLKSNAKSAPTSFTEVKKKPLTAEERTAAQKAEYQRIWVFQRRPFLKSNRFAVTPMLGVNINDPLIHFFTSSLDMNYHLSEKMGLGIRMSGTLDAESSTFDKVIQEYGVLPKVSRPLWSASAQFQYSPFYGKFSFFKSWIIPWELYSRVGAGWVQTFIDGHVLITAGAGQRIFLNRWMTLVLDVDYQLFQETFSQANEPDQSVFLSNIITSVGLSMYLPFDFEYQELK